ncbi:MAG: ATP-dependent helicase, partial [Candidatus Magasanikbacteria bacterium]|nr:ATP-dependent helicase [Candidatus Magasanikbacteria bacterium]
VMTVHGAKGLEFPHVFLVNLVEDRFPTRSRGERIEIPLPLIKEQLPSGDSHYQEERRLFYVALTRAKENVYLFSAANYGGVRQKKISRFLAELGFKDQTAGAATGITSISPIVLGKNGSDDSPVYAIPSAFSFSQLRSYETCPYQYKLAHIVKIPLKGSASFSFGTTLHSTMQQFYTRVQALNQATQTSLFGEDDAAADHEQQENFGKIRVPTLPELLKIYEDKWLGDWYQNKRQREEYWAKGRKILQDFYASEAGRWTIPVALECWFKIKVGAYTVHGRIDRVDKLADGSLEIIDYKTGRSKTQVTGDEKEQLLIYQIAVQSLPEYRRLGPAGRLTFYYLDDLTRTSFLGESAELANAQAKIVGLIDRIAAQDFRPTPNQIVCGRCDFRDICEYRAV